MISWCCVFLRDGLAQSAQCMKTSIRSATKKSLRLMPPYKLARLGPGYADHSEQNADGNVVDVQRRELKKIPSRRQVKDQKQESQGARSDCPQCDVSRSDKLRDRTRAGTVRPYQCHVTQDE